MESAYLSCRGPFFLYSGSQRLYPLHVSSGAYCQLDSLDTSDTDQKRVERAASLFFAAFYFQLHCAPGLQLEGASELLKKSNNIPV
jgi:hypothetical protein